MYVYIIIYIYIYIFIYIYIYMSPDSGSLAPRPPNGMVPQAHALGNTGHGTIHTYMHPCIHPSIHTYRHTHRQTYIPIYLPTYIPTYLRTYVPTYLHTHAHTHVTNAHTAWESWVIYTCKYVYVYIYILYTQYICCFGALWKGVPTMDTASPRDQVPILCQANFFTGDSKAEVISSSLFCHCKLQQVLLKCF